MMSDRFIPLPEWRELPEAQMRRRARDFYMELRRRRAVRDFSNRSPARDIPDSRNARVSDIGRKPLEEIVTFP